MPEPRKPARYDPETNEPLYPGQLTRAELAEWLRESERRWKAVFFAEAPPKIEGEWVWSDLHGWCRKNPNSAGRRKVNR